MRHPAPLPTLLITLALASPLATMSAAGAADPAAATCDGKVPTIVVDPTSGLTPTNGTPGDDVILGTLHNDWIVGGDGNDTICGLGGADRIDGGAGDDRLFGGLDDEYWPDDGYSGDILVPGPGDDHVDLGDDPASATVDPVDWPARYDTLSYHEATGPVVVNLEEGTASGEGNDTIAVPEFSGGILGSAYDDVLVGSSGHDRIQAGAGDDRILAGDGDDYIEPDRVGLSVAVSPGNDLVHAGRGDDSVYAVRGRDRVHGDRGADYLAAEGRGSRVVGGGGSDRLEGAPGVDLHGGGGEDLISTDLGRRSIDEVDGGRGLDRLTLWAPRSDFGWGGRWLVDVPGDKIVGQGRKRLVYKDVEDLYLQASGGRVTYRGGPGRDAFTAARAMKVIAYGGRGRDILTGGKRSDFLDGGPGRDRLDGREGRDRCLRGERTRSCEVRR